MLHSISRYVGRIITRKQQSQRRRSKKGGETNIQSSGDCRVTPSRSSRDMPMLACSVIPFTEAHSHPSPWHQRGEMGASPVRPQSRGRHRASVTGNRDTDRTSDNIYSSGKIDYLSVLIGRRPLPPRVLCPRVVAAPPFSPWRRVIADGILLGQPQSNEEKKVP